MSLAVLRSRALAGMDAPSVSVEVHLANGFPGLTIVVLPDAEVRESKDRVRAALQNTGFTIPARRITVNLAPADLPKESGYRLVCAVGIHSVCWKPWTFSLVRTVSLVTPVTPNERRSPSAKLTFRLLFRDPT